MRINRTLAWRIVIFDLVVVTLLLLYLSDYVFDYFGWLLLQFFVVVAVLRKSLRIERIDSDEKKITNWKAVDIGALAGFFTSFIILSLLLLSWLPIDLIGVGVIILVSMIGGLFGIIGGLIGKYLSHSTLGAWIGGSIGGFILPVLIMLGGCGALGGC
jgi:hypothetical protein